MLFLDQNVLDMLENTKLCEPCLLLIKIDQFFLIGQRLMNNKCQPALPLIGIFQKIVQIEKKLLLKTSNKSLKG